jgi:hypothetical protein
LWDSGSSHWCNRSESSLSPRLTISFSVRQTALFPEPATRGQRSEGVERAHMYVPAAVRKCSIARLQEVAHMYPAFWIGVLVAVALLGVRTRLCLISG